MTHPNGFSRFVVLVVLGAAASGCEDKPAAPLAPTASALAPAKASSASSKAFQVDKASSKVEFMMEAPKEKIRGRVAGTSEGELHVDLADVTKSTGLVTADISEIELFKRDVKDGKEDEEKKEPTQNEHARAWLEISEDAPADAKKKNARVEFSIKSIEQASEKDLSKLTGANRKVTLLATGEFLLHGRKTTKTAKLEATFHYEGDKVTSVTVKTVEPFAVGLAEHDVRPREGFGKLAQKTLEVLAPKVAKEALVSVEFTAKVAGGSAPAGSAEPKASAEPSASASAAP